MTTERELTPVIVEWHDAHVGVDGWEDLENVKDDGPCIVHSTGFLLSEEDGGKEGHVSLVATWSQDDMVHSVFHIPSPMVQKIHILMRSHELADVALFPKTGRSGG